MFDKIPEWERQLGKVGRLRDALKIASEWEARRLGLSQPATQRSWTTR